MTRIAIIGAGAWGTALAIVAARAGHDVSLWSRNAAVVESVQRTRRNELYLPDFKIPDDVFVTDDAKHATDTAELIILAVPSHAMRQTLEQLKPHAEPRTIFVNVAKGIEIETGARVSEIVDSVFDDWTIMPRYICLSGPSFAQEVAAGHPTALVAACGISDNARIVQELLSVENLRVYTNDDLVGVELGGALKNVIAVAAGMVSGLGLGANTRAALITRGLAEMTRFAFAHGARRETLSGLAGLGDLVLTCTGELSRNRRVGLEIGRGRALEDVLSGMREVAEGVRTTRAVYEIARRQRIEMPITAAVYEALYENKSAREAVNELMTRPLREEF